MLNQKDILPVIFRQLHAHAYTRYVNIHWYVYTQAQLIHNVASRPYFRKRAQLHTSRTHFYSMEYRYYRNQFYQVRYLLTQLPHVMGSCVIELSLKIITKLSLLLPAALLVVSVALLKQTQLLDHDVRPCRYM